jgi:hypothetical protein
MEDSVGMEIYGMPLQEPKWWSRNFLLFKEVMDYDEW